MLDAGDYDRNGLQEVYFWLTEGTAYLRQHLYRTALWVTHVGGFPVG